MLFGEKRYNSIDYYLKTTFGEKTIKLSLDGGFSCPNRDGKIGTGGCLFCSEAGSGDFTSGRIDIGLQIENQINLTEKKWPKAKYLAYFQSFSNTYGSAERLKKVYSEAVSNPKISGLCIATRPDCIDEDVVEVLKYFNRKTFLWVELGLQTSNENTARIIRRGYKNNSFEEACKILREAGIKVVAHMIINLPGENESEYFNTLDFIIKNGAWGIKFHMLHIMKNTDMHSFYNENKFEIMDANEYVELLTELIARMPVYMTVHRVTGDSPAELLVAPKWTRNKIYIIGNLEKKLKEKKLYQSALFQK